MHGIALLKKKRVLALMALILVVGGVSFYNWHKNESLGVDGRRDNCAEATAPAISMNTLEISVPDGSPQALKVLLSDAPIPTRDPTVLLTPGIPVLSHPIRMYSGYDFNDCPHWLLPEYDASGHLAQMVDFVYDYPHEVVRFAYAGSIFPGDPRYGNPFPYLSMEQATAPLKQQRDLNAKADPAPELVFLPLDIGVPEKPGRAYNWRGGGAVPSDPIWLVAGADGRDDLIGEDKRIYTLHDIPWS